MPQSAQNGFSLISNQKLAQLFAAMLECRMIEERARALWGKRARQFAASGEAVVTAVTLDLLPEDTVAASANDLAACFLKGAPLGSVLRVLRPQVKPAPRPGAKPYDAHHVLAPWLSAGERLKRATGAAIANPLRRNDNVAVVFHESREADSAWHETLQFAAAHYLPMVFVRTGEAETGKPRGKRKAAEGELKRDHRSLPTIIVDCNDAVAVYRVAQEAIAHARRGSGPTLIECVPFRVARAPADKLAGDPIAAMEQYLEGKGLPAGRLKQAVTVGFGRELGAALKGVNRPARTGRKKG
ncbi:MAG: thiamine pyrophosphate-dependent enzyme [Terracidiphilus sp.]